MSILTRDQILAARLQTEDVPVPEWGGVVRVSEMTGTDRDAWEQSLVPKTAGAPANVENIRARLVAQCVVDEAGSRLFSTEDAVDLGTRSAAALDRVAKVAQRLNGLTADAVEQASGN